MTIATIGRRTKKAPMVLLPGFLGRVRCGSSPRGRRLGRGRRLLRNHLDPAPHALDAFDDDPIAGTQALFDDPVAAVARTDRDDLDGGRVVGSDDRDLV